MLIRQASQIHKLTPDNTNKQTYFIFRSSKGDLTNNMLTIFLRITAWHPHFTVS